MLTIGPMPVCSSAGTLADMGRRRHKYCRLFLYGNLRRSVDLDLDENAVWI